MAITRRRFVASGAGAVAWVACGHEGDPAPGREDWDVCVIGSGFAGILLAQRTAERGLRTLVVEAGGPGAPGAAERFGYTNSGPIEYPVNSTRMIAIGGASGHWTGLVNRLRPEDFRVRSEFGQGVDWPLDYAELAPWYCRAERALDVAGREAVPGAEPPRDCPYPEVRGDPYRPPEITLGGRALRFFEVPLALRDGAPLRLDRSEVPAFEASPNGALLSGHQALRLVAGDAHQVDHVLVQGPGQEPRPIRARVFVVAAGVIESARLLLLSRSRWHPAGLGNATDLVGRYFVEHVTLNWRGVARPPRRLPPGLHRSYDLHDTFRREHLNACHVQLFAEEPRADGSQPVFWKLQPEMQSRPENRVALSGRQRDPWGSAAPDVHLAYSERDQRTIARGTALLRGELRAAGLRPDAPARSVTWRAHPAGTCRMGFGADTGVVDRHLRVFEADNVYVSGACVFPTSGTANPTLTVVALTLRLAEHLVESLA